jgi:hypothetical protein
MNIVHAQYEKNGYVYEEQECSTCGKVLKHPLFKEHMKERKKRQKGARRNANKGSRSRKYNRSAQR